MASLPCSNLNDTGLQGQLPTTWAAAFPNLDSLQLGYNNLSGPIPSSYANFTRLQRLVLKPENDFMCGPVPPNLPFQRECLRCGS